MKEEILSEAIGKVEERFVTEMLNFDDRKYRHRRKWRRVTKAAACLLVAGAALTAVVVGEGSYSPPTVKSMEKQVKETVEDLNRKLESGELKWDTMTLVRSDIEPYKDSEYYRRLVGLGTEALPYLSEEIEKNELQGLMGYLMASAVEDILQCDLMAMTGKSFAHPEEFSQLWKSERNQVYADVRTLIHGNMETEKKERKLKNFGLLILPYLYNVTNMEPGSGQEPDLKYLPEEIRPFCLAFLEEHPVTEAELQAINNLTYADTRITEGELPGYTQYAEYTGLLTDMNTSAEKKELSVKLLADEEGRSVIALVNGIQVELRKKSEFLAYSHCDITTVDWDEDGIQEILMVFRDARVLDLRLLKLGGNGKWRVLRLPGGYRNRSINMTMVQDKAVESAAIKPDWTDFEIQIPLQKIDPSNRKWLKQQGEINVPHEEDYRFNHKKGTLEISHFLSIGKDGEGIGVLWQEFKLNKEGTALRYGKTGYRETS
ncbi:MAG: hypothetical protein J1F02_06375 [Lachnospiraceae bacterium]|nr:hypothetical protein [Lachnospiraceae bacterium]